tara:strand:- start:4762 stop:5142 length:381 start_codon:yes stop_codon:yes gene_type:complete
MEEAEDIIIYLPNGEEISLQDFDTAVVNGEIDFNDGGFIWYDGTLIETNGEPYMGMTMDDVYSLLAPYIEGEEEYMPDGEPVEIDDVDDVDDGDLDIEINVSKDKVNFLWKLSAIGLLLYIAYKQD